MDSLKGLFGAPEVSSTNSILLFLQPEVVGTYLPGTGPWAGGTWCGARTPHSQDIPSTFYPPHVDVGLAHFTSATLLPVWIDVVSLIP